MGVFRNFPDRKEITLFHEKEDDEYTLLDLLLLDAEPDQNIISSDDSKKDE